MGRQKLQQDLVFRLRADIAQLEKGLKKGRKQISGFQKSVRSVGQSMIGAFAGIAVIQGIGNAIKGIAKLEQTIRRVALTAKGGEKEFSKLATQLGGSTKFTALEAADSMQMLAQAGFSVSEILSATPGVLNLAASSLIDIALAADIASNIMSGFGIDASEMNRVADILVTTTDSANTNVEQLGEAFKLVAPIARSAGISINDAAGFIGVLGDAGLQGTIAGTQLKGAIAALINPTAKGEKVLKRLGVTVSMTAEGSLNLAKTLEDLKVAGLTTKDAFRLFNKISAAGALVMAEGTEKARALSLATEEVGTSAAKAAGLMDTLQGDMDLLASAWDANIKKGGVFNGILRDLLQLGTQVLQGKFLADDAAVIFRTKAIGEMRMEVGKLRKDIERSKSGKMGIIESSFFSAKAASIEVDRLKAKIQLFTDEIQTLSGELTEKQRIERQGERDKAEAEAKDKTASKAAADARNKELQDLALEEAAREKVAAAAEKEAAAIWKKRLAASTKAVTEDPIENVDAFPTTQSITGFSFASLIVAETEEAQEQIDLSISSITGNIDSLAIASNSGASIVTNAFQGMSNVITNALGSTENIFTAFGKFFGDFVKGMIIKLVAMTVAALALVVVLSLIPGLGGTLGISEAIKDAGKFKAAFGLLSSGTSFADGGVSQGGLAMVGERGKELVAMPQGARVLSHQQTMNAASGGGNMVIIPDVRIKGEDIWLSFTEANRKLGNTRG